MKKLFTVIFAVVALGTFGLFAEEAESSKTESKKNLLTFEATAGVIGFGINEVVTYDYMFNNNFGIGAGVNASEGMVGTIDGFVDLKFKKWNFGVGGGYSYARSSSDFLLRAVYHGDSWNWGPFKAGMTLGTDWHMFNIGTGKNQEIQSQTENTVNNILYIMGILPRFVLGINMQLGM